MPVRLTFLGGVGTVTGSKYLLEGAEARIMIDCGLFQGFKNNRLKNWAPLACDPATIDAVVLTHAHLDHSGYLPLLIRNGFEGPVYSTEATRELCTVLLPDCGHLAEREAEFANKHGFSKHSPALPLYTEKDARFALERFEAAPFGEARQIAPGVSIAFRRAGHILGASIVRVEIDGISLTFSGDLGRPGAPTMLAPESDGETDYLVVESTYGDRGHPDEDCEAILAELIGRTASRGGTVLIPAFAVGRTQTILYYLERLKRLGKVPDLPIFMDSPMAANASEIFCRHSEEHRLSEKDCKRIWDNVTYIRDPEDSKALDRNPMPKVILSASGMATGGRVVHHLKVLAPNPDNCIVFAGYQAPGTRGATITEGAGKVKIHGRYVPVRAEVHNLTMLSAHADADEIMAWLKTFDTPPESCFITHGEPRASDALRHRIEEELDWTCLVPEYKDIFELQG